MRHFPLSDFVTEYALAFGLEVAEGNPFHLLKNGKPFSPKSFPYRFAHLPISTAPKNTFHLLEEETVTHPSFFIKQKKTFVVDVEKDFSFDEQVVKRMKKFPKSAEFAQLTTVEDALILLEGTAKRKGYFDEKEWPCLVRLWKGLEKKGRITSWGIRENGEWKAVQLMVEGSDGWAFTYFVGTHPETRPWSTWLMVKILEQYRELGFKKVDLLGANLPTVAQFKKSFGGQMTTYLEFNRKPWWRRLL